MSRSIGFGTGLNLGFYDPEKVEHVWGLDPSAEMLKMTEAGGVQFPETASNYFAGSLSLLILSRAKSYSSQSSRKDPIASL